MRFAPASTGRASRPKGSTPPPCPWRWRPEWRARRRIAAAVPAPALRWAAVSSAPYRPRRDRCLRAHREHQGVGFGHGGGRVHGVSPIARPDRRGGSSRRVRIAEQLSMSALRRPISAPRPRWHRRQGPRHPPAPRQSLTASPRSNAFDRRHPGGQQALARFWRRAPRRRPQVSARGSAPRSTLQAAAGFDFARNQVAQPPSARRRSG